LQFFFFFHILSSHHHRRPGASSSSSRRVGIIVVVDDHRPGSFIHAREGSRLGFSFINEDGPVFIKLSRRRRGYKGIGGFQWR
jgi:hypothetical protein